MYEWRRAHRAPFLTSHVLQVLVVVNLAFVIWWGICTFNFWRGAQDEMGKRISTRTFLPFLCAAHRSCSLPTV